METIFVSIASYRDPKTQHTVNNLISQAAHPNNLRIAVIEQNLKEDNFHCSPLRNKVNILKLKEGVGPAHARFLASTLWKKETYFLQIDSHMSFIKNWDIILIDDLKKCPTIHSVLTCYPPPLLPKDNIHIRSITENWSWDKNNHIIAQGKILKPSQNPSLGVFVSAGFLFTRAEPFLKQIPFDPNLKFLFQGEEILLSARLFTNGWNVYHPSKCVCAHDYIRQDQPKVWNDKQDFWKKNKHVVRKYRYLTYQLNNLTPPDNTTYGLGKIRDPQQWKKIIGLNKIFL